LSANEFLLSMVVDLLPVATEIVVWSVLRFRNILTDAWNFDNKTAERVNIFNSTILFALTLMTSGLRTIQGWGWVLIVVAFFVVLSAVPFAFYDYKHKPRYRWLIMAFVVVIVVLNRVSQNWQDILGFLQGLF